MATMWQLNMFMSLHRLFVSHFETICDLNWWFELLICVIWIDDLMVLWRLCICAYPLHNESIWWTVTYFVVILLFCARQPICTVASKFTAASNAINKIINIGTNYLVLIYQTSWIIAHILACLVYANFIQGSFEWFYHDGIVPVWQNNSWNLMTEFFRLCKTTPEITISALPFQDFIDIW